jgi:hypothetical protein
MPTTHRGSFSNNLRHGETPDLQAQHAPDREDVGRLEPALEMISVDLQHTDPLGEEDGLMVAQKDVQHLLDALGVDLGQGGIGQDRLDPVADLRWRPAIRERQPWLGIVAGDPTPALGSTQALADRGAERALSGAVMPAPAREDGRGPQQAHQRPHGDALDVVDGEARTAEARALRRGEDLPGADPVGEPADFVDEGALGPRQARLDAMRFDQGKAQIATLCALADTGAGATAEKGREAAGEIFLALEADEGRAVAGVLAAVPASGCPQRHRGAEEVGSSGAPSR